MTRWSTWAKNLSLALLLCAAVSVVSAQTSREPAAPLSLSGTLTGGYYGAQLKNGHESEQSSAIGSARANLSGFFHAPEFLTFSFKPQGSLGRQSSEGIFPDGRGFFASTTFLAGGVAPLTFSYGRVDRKLVTFGPQDRLAGLEANAQQDTLNLDWRVRLRGLPEFRLNYSRYNDNYEPLQALTSGTENHTRLFTLGMTHKLAGWNLDSSFRWENANQNLLNLFDPRQAPFAYDRKDRDFRASAHREFVNDSSRFGLNLLGGYTNSDTQISGRPFDQSFKFANGNAYYRRGEKFSASVRAGLTTNLVGASVDQLSSNNPATPGSQTIQFIPTQARVNLYTTAGQAQYALTKDLRVDGEVSREQTVSPTAIGLVNPNSTLTSVQAGIGYGRTFRRWNFNSHYAANTGRFEYALVGPSQSFGHRANLNATVVTLAGFELSGSVQGYVQNLRDHVNLQDNGLGGTVSASRTLRNWRLRATYNREKNDYEYGLVRYNSRSNGVTLGAANHIAEFTATHQIRNGLSFQSDPRFQLVSGTQAAVLQNAFPNTIIVPSTAKWTSVIGSFHLSDRVIVRGSWQRNQQTLLAAVNNHYTEWEVNAGYKFRSMTFDFGYIRHNQDFGIAGGQFWRNRFFFRIVRDFRLF